MARITLSFVLTALYLAGSSSAAVSSHPNADVLGFEKRAPAPVTVGRVGHAGSAPATAPVKRHRRSAKGAKRSETHHERKEMEAVPQPAKRDLNTPSSGAGKISIKVERAHPEFGQLNGVHPQVFLQQHINRGVRRHAKMTGRELPADIDEHFERSIRKRWISAHGHDDGLVLRKRQRVGHSGSENVKTGNEALVAVNEDLGLKGLGKALGKAAKAGKAGKAGKGGKGAAAAGGAAAGAAAGAAGAAAAGAQGAKGQGQGAQGAGAQGQQGQGAAGAGTGTGSAAGAGTGTATGAANSGQDQGGAGFSQADLDALNGNTVTKAGNPTAANSLGLDIESADVGYFATVQMGTPPQDVKILMDSGSADLWIPGENCATCGNTHTTLGTKSSSTFVDSGKAFQVTYGTGAVAGTIIQDTLSIAGLTLNNHTFGACNQETQDFSSASVPFDGLMGLAQSTLSEQKTPTPIESLASNKLTTAAQMGFALGRVADGTNDGEITFGGIDQTKFNGDLTIFANVNPQGFWEGAMDDVTVDGKSTQLQGRTAILDTGTTLIVAPPADATAVHAAIPGAKSDGQGGFTVPCTTTAQVALSFGGQTFNIDPRDLAFQPLTNNLQGDCASGISSGQIGGAQEWLVGDVFLKSVYFATDVENNQIGLAARPAASAGGQAAAGSTGSASQSAAGSADQTASAAGATDTQAAGGATGKGAKGAKGQQAN